MAAARQADAAALEQLVNVTDVPTKGVRIIAMQSVSVELDTAPAWGIKVPKS